MNSRRRNEPPAVAARPQSKFQHAERESLTRLAIWFSPAERTQTLAASQRAQHSPRSCRRINLDRTKQPYILRLLPIRQRLSRVAEGTGPTKPQQPGPRTKVLIPARWGR